MNLIAWQWTLIIGSSILLLVVTPYARDREAFFRGRQDDREPGVWILLSSLVISWLFAKSITNAANLGLSFGLPGGVAYAAYYLSFLTAGWVIYQLRTKGGFGSIHDFLESRFGKGAIAVFTLLIGFRLFNEVWSNTMVIGSYFGPDGSGAYVWSIILFTILTLAYSLKGGMSSSILTDVIQMILFGVLLAVVLGFILQGDTVEVEEGALATPVTWGSMLREGSWTMDQGGNLLLVAILQSLSYPFHDPVLTDRGFISSPKTTLRAFCWAALLGGICIVLFSFVGIYGRLQGVMGQAPVEVAKLLGPVLMLVMNFIMITSAASTLDSTFSSFAKLTVVDLGKAERVSPGRGRWAMVIITLLGSVPIFLGAEILSATTISGTMVIGLAPVFLLWWLRPPAISFYLSVGIGVLMGVALVNGWWPDRWLFTQGKYADLLGVNLIGTLLCFVGYLLPFLVRKSTQPKTIN